MDFCNNWLVTINAVIVMVIALLMMVTTNRLNKILFIKSVDAMRPPPDMHVDPAHPEQLRQLTPAGRAALRAAASAIIIGLNELEGSNEP